MVTERELLPAPGEVEARRDVGHVHEALSVIAGDPGDNLVLLAVPRVAEADPVADPPAARAADRAQAAALAYPVGERQLPPRRPRCLGEARSRCGCSRRRRRAGGNSALGVRRPWPFVLQRGRAYHPNAIGRHLSRDRTDRVNHAQVGDPRLSRPRARKAAMGSPHQAPRILYVSLVGAHLVVRGAVG